MKNLTFLILILLLNVFFATNVAFSQGNIQGIVKDSISNEVLSFASIGLKQNGKILSSTITDADGHFFIDNIPNGEYTLILSYVGKQKAFTNISVLSGTSNFTLEIDLTNRLGVVTVKGIPGLIMPERIDKYDSEILVNLGIINIIEIESIGSAQVETPNGISYKGARPGTSVYYIDGMRTYGDLYIPMSAVESVVVYNCGIPAQYGNTTSAVIVVETKSWLDYY